MTRFSSVKNIIVKILVAPFMILLFGILAYYSVLKVGEDSPRYNIENIAHTASETAKWIHYVSEHEGGAAYNLGDFDYSPTGMLKKFPAAVWVSLYRPHLWEVNNIVMLLSAFSTPTHYTCI